MLGLLDRWGLAPYMATNKSDHIITFWNGSEIRFIGLDDVEKLKSLESPSSFWLEEATEMTEADLEQVSLRLRGATPGYKQILLTFNPISQLHWLRRRFFEGAQSDTFTLRTTYRDNPHLDEVYRRELEALRDRDRALWQVYARGEWGVLEGLVYDPWLVEPWPEQAPNDRWYGLDFGFNNPTALVEVWERDRVHRVREVVYETGLTTGDLLARMEAAGARRDRTIWADAAEPARIEELSRAGYRVRPAPKGADSVRGGIALVRGLDIRTEPGSTNILRELETYKWAEDRHGNRLDEPTKWNDHAMDAVRYAIMGQYRKARTATSGDVLKGLGIF
jgi:phage terminase large subunit